MPSTFTPSLKIELIGNGEQPTTWGITTNNNMGTLIEQSIAGVQPITLTGNTVLSNFNGISDQARNAVLVFNGALSNTANVVAPSVEKTYIVSNRAGANVVIKTSTGVGISVSNNTNVLIYCDGAEFYTAVNPNDVIGNLSVSGNQTVAGSISIGGDITINNKISSNAGTLTLNSSTGVVDMATNSGAFTPPTGTDGERPGSPDLGMTRWNSTQGILEIWNGVQWQNITGNYAIDYVIVAGGGGGGFESFQGSGGGGAGGYIANSTTVTVGTGYSITIGSGGSVNNKGANSVAFSLTAIGGGAGAGNSNTGVINGGSGGGRCTRDNPAENFGPGSGTSGQGFAGSSGISGYIGAGGGGASEIGQGVNGGSGIASAISGASTYYAGGGGGGNRQVGNGGAGGLGGGGSNNTAGTANTGGGGAGGGSDPGAFTGTAGGSGVVIVRYASASQRGTGGTVTSYSDAGITYFVHTFTSSGTFTA
jgi:hypothetical protein